MVNILSGVLFWMQQTVEERVQTLVRTDWRLCATDIRIECKQENCASNHSRRFWIEKNYLKHFAHNLDNLIPGISPIKVVCLPGQYLLMSPWKYTPCESWDENAQVNKLIFTSGFNCSLDDCIKNLHLKSYSRIEILKMTLSL